MPLERVAMLVFGVVLCSASSVYSQDYPNKPVRIVTSPCCGGGGDFSTRIIADGIAVPLGQAVVVDNRPTNLGPELVWKAPPDGYTLLVAGGAFIVGPMVTKAPYDSEKDFATITMVNRYPSLLVVHPSVPAKTVKELIALAKARPGELNFASGSPGGANQRAAAVFGYLAGVKIALISYKGSAQSISDLLSGAIHLTFETGGLVLPHIKSGKLRLLGVTSAQPSPLYPGVPTIASSLPGYESMVITAMWAPAKTPPAVINHINQEVTRLYAKPEVKEKFLNNGLEPVTSSPEELAAIVKAELSQWAKLIKEAGIKVE